MPLSYRDFTGRLHRDVTPAEAERQYEEYKDEHAEQFRRKHFADERNDPKLRAAHDPRMLLEPIRQRAEAAGDAAREFHEGAEAAADDPSATNPVSLGTVASTVDEEAAEAGEPNKVEADDDLGVVVPAKSLDRRDGRGRFPVPPTAWAPTRLAHDLRQCCRLVRALDAEKKLGELTANPLLVAEEEDEGVRAILATNDPTPEPGDKDGAGGVGKRTRKNGGGSGGVGLDDTEMKVEQGETAVEDAPEVDKADGEGTDQMVVVDGTAEIEPAVIAAALDARVKYLWCVHGVDYYAGAELSVSEYLTAPPAGRGGMDASCLMRGPKPASGGSDTATAGEGGDDGALVDVDGGGNKAGEGEPDGGSGGQKRRAKARDPGASWANRVDRWFLERLTRGDPAEARVGRARVQSELDTWMQSCVLRQDENRYGCTLSAKLFIGVEYVMKHIKSKQVPAIEAQTERINDQIYMENYLAAARVEDADARRRVRASGGGGGAGGAGAHVTGSGGRAGTGGDDRSGGGGRAQGQGRGGGRGGRGGRGSMLMSGALMHGPAPGMMMVPVPGAGPLGPFVQVPIGSEAGGGAVNSPHQPLVMMAAPSAGKTPNPEA